MSLHQQFGGQGTPPSLQIPNERERITVASPTSVIVERREPKGYGTPSFITAPDNQRQELFPLSIGWQEAPDPIRQSDFWAENGKIKPNAHMRIVSHLGVGSWGNWEHDRFEIGKLIGYFLRPMYAGKQQPSLIRANIREAVPTTYGALTEIRPAGPEVQYAATGFTLPISESSDGYPY
jgi:hypothetical protein